MSDKKHIITIAGKPASGKSTTAKLVAEKLGFGHYSTGELFRAIAAEHQQDVLEANLHAEKNVDFDIDAQVDDRQMNLGINEDNFVIDARLGWHFIPQSFKVYLDLDTITGAERILSNPDTERNLKENIPETPAQYANVLDERLTSESRRYEKLYGVDNHNHENFDLVVDTKANSPERAATLVIEAYNRWITN
ncbi:MAG: nucleoside monophosphate kinase [Candidatus Microsaccharimonas sp.]